MATRGPIALLLGDPAQLQSSACRLPGTRPGLDAEAARRQWDAFGDALNALGAQVHVLEPRTATTCFVRDAVLVGGTARGPAFVTTRLEGQRVADPSAVGSWLRDQGVRRILWTAIRRVAGGDLIWSDVTLLAGVGRASSPVAARAVAQSFGARALPLPLVDARWPTLDQALCVLGEGRALWVPQAFDDAGASALQAMYPRLAAVDCPSALRVGDYVVLDRGAKEAHAAVEELDLDPVSVDLGAWLDADAGPAALVCPLDAR